MHYDPETRINDLTRTGLSLIAVGLLVAAYYSSRTVAQFVDLATFAVYYVTTAFFDSLR